MTARKMKGAVPIVVTPMLENGDIDVKSCQSLANYLVDNHVGGLYLFGSAGEGFLLNTQQRAEATHAFAEAVNGRVPLLVGCNFLAPRTVFEFFNEVKDANIDGFHFIPEDLKLGEERFIHQVKTYADKAPFPFYLYHNIKRGRAITINIAQSVKDHPNVAGMKVGGYDKAEMEAFLKLQDENFQILGSGGGQFLHWFGIGAEAVTASSACCLPKLFHQIYTAFKEGDLKTAEAKQKIWVDFHKAIPNTAPDNGEYAAEEKYILHRLGVLATDACHFPYRTLTSDEKKTVDRELEKVMALLGGMD
ncbi:MAG: dihydrodipicolinate synthase family protein [Deltaproteobacteria bacterium]|nr:dihydrodipicolinate synthase family protein [Deltaproteobacteria bacterium]